MGGWLGDTQILDTSLNTVATYRYNAFGEIISSITSGSIAQINPLRYRGYFYDNETGLYYVGSRYYDPVTCRWINADGLVFSGEFDEGAGVTRYNLFAYCGNNPVMYTDFTGDWIVRAIATAVSTVVFGGIAYAIGRALGMSGASLASFTTAFAGVGLALGLWKGVAVLHQINALIKPVIYFFSNPGKLYFGLKLLNIIQFEIHAPHHSKPIHFVVRIFGGTGQRIWEWWFKR